MKIDGILRYGFILLIVFVSCSGYGDDSKYPEGFGNAKFGDNIDSLSCIDSSAESIKDSLPIRKGENWRVYRGGDIAKIKIGTFNVRTVFYNFYKSKLAEIVFDFEQTSDMSLLLQALENKYGKPSKNYYCGWENDTIGIVFVPNNFLIYQYKPLFRQSEMDEKEENDKKLKEIENNI